MRVRLVTPTTADIRSVDDVQPLARADTEISVARLGTGPACVESAFDEALAVPGLLANMAEAERDGVDAIVIDCMGDPALDAGRELLSIPVLGAAQSSMLVATLLAHRFSIVTVLDSVVPMLENLARRYGVESKLASVRVVDIPVLDLDAGGLVDALAEQSLLAVEEDGAHAIVFGCTGMEGHAPRIAEALAAAGHPGIPVIDPVLTALKLAEAVVELGLSQSQATWASPPPKEITGYDVAAPAAAAGRP